MWASATPGIGGIASRQIIFPAAQIAEGGGASASAMGWVGGLSLYGFHFMPSITADITWQGNVRDQEVVECQEQMKPLEE